MSNATSLKRGAQLVLLVMPMLLAGCYVVPIVPVQPRVYGPAYHPYPRPYYRGYYRVGEAQVPATADAAPAPQPAAHIEVASNSR